MRYVIVFVVDRVIRAVRGNTLTAFPTIKIIITLTSSYLLPLHYPQYYQVGRIAIAGIIALALSSSFTIIKTRPQIRRFLSHFYY